MTMPRFLRPCLALALGLSLGLAGLASAKSKTTSTTTSTGTNKPKAAGALDVPLSSAVASQKLRAFRQQVRDAAAQGRKPVVVFDLDDTLVRLFTKKQIPGAAAFVSGVLSDGARVVYQCGRKEGQRAVTEALLTSNGMPINTKAQLWLKSKSEKACTVDWKKAQKPQLEALGCPIGFFDNEKVNVRMFRAEFPQSCVFRLTTTAYYPDPGGKGTIWPIKDFCPTN